MQLYDAAKNTAYVKEISDRPRKVMNYLALIVRVVHICVAKPSAVAFGGKEMKPALTVVS